MHPGRHEAVCGTHAYVSGPIAVVTTVVFRHTSSERRQKSGPQRNVLSGAVQLTPVEMSVPALLARHELM